MRNEKIATIETFEFLFCIVFIIANVGRFRPRFYSPFFIKL
jgi:hypothetical protein